MKQVLTLWDTAGRVQRMEAVPHRARPHAGRATAARGLGRAYAAGSSPAGLMLLAAASWGLGLVMTKVTLQQLAPLDVLAVELAVGAVVIGAVLLARRRVGTLRQWRAFAVLGLLEPGLSYGLGDFGLAHTSASHGALLVASDSIFAVLVARLVLSERLAPRTAVAVVIGFAGSVAIGASGGGAHMGSALGDVLVLAGTASAAGYTVAARRLADTEADAVTVTAVQLLAASVVSLPLLAYAAASGHSRLLDADSAHLLAAVATGVLTTAVPFLLFNVAIREVEIASAALLLNLTPVIGAVLAAVLLGEALTALGLIGGGVVLVAALGAQAGAAAPTLSARPAGSEIDTRSWKALFRSRGGSRATRV